MNTPAQTLPGCRIEADDPAERPLWREWLLTNGLGGFAMGSPAGVNTRRYHALFIASLNPPVDRVVALSAIDEALTLDPGSPDEQTFRLTPFHFATAPDRAIAALSPCRFERTPLSCRWTYAPAAAAGPCIVTRTLELADRSNAASIRYRVESSAPARLALRPLTPLRDFHHLARDTDLESQCIANPVENGVVCARGNLAVRVLCPDARFHPGPAVWRGVEYIREALRDSDSTEALYSPGVFHIEIGRPGVLEAPVTVSIDSTAPNSPRETHEPTDAHRWLDRKADRLARCIAYARSGTGAAPPLPPESDSHDPARLAAAADDFIVRRGAGRAGMTSVIAGYPWFADWGRDTMIALPGLMLATGRHDEALRTLAVFADARRNGLIPNRFDDRSGPAHYNTVDAPLWFLHAAAEYRRATKDQAGYAQRLAPACRDIIRAFQEGTEHGIRLDDDGLVTAGDPHTQLTWMDAQRDGVTFTPRYGKTVEINALWRRGLLATADATADDDPPYAERLRHSAERTGEAIRARFVRPDGLGLYDRLEPGRDGRWNPVHEIRPNQIFAVSLPGSPLTPAQQRGTLAVVSARLLTPFGLRTLDPADPRYQSRYEGTMFERDRAYHNGTVWPWLLGPYAEAILRVGRFSADSRSRARAALTAILGVIAGHGLGQIPEIYDAEPPHRPDGCPAQAWSVAEPLRVLHMLNVEHAHRDPPDRDPPDGEPANP